jgi:hypothetical protein
MGFFLKQLLLFILLVIFVFAGINLFQTFYNAEPVQYKNKYESVINDSQVFNGIILGTSYATHSMRPTLLDESGYRFYNYAFNGSNPEFHLKWYNHFIHKNKIKPKYCLYEVDFFMFDKDWLWRRFEQDAEYFPTNLFVNELLSDSDFKKMDVIINRFPFLKYRTQIKQSLLLKEGSQYFNSNNYDRGYISYSVPFDNKLFKPKLDYKIDSSQVKYFKLLLKQILDDDIKIIFVMTPQYGISEDKYYQMESLKIIDSISKKFNIPILNYKTKLRSGVNNNINYFTDWGHMNHSGAQIFSKDLAKEIKALMRNKDSMR